MKPETLIRAARRRAGLTQAELARRAGTSQPVVSAYEHGRRDPSVGTSHSFIVTFALPGIRTGAILGFGG